MCVCIRNVKNPKRKAERQGQRCRLIHRQTQTLTYRHRDRYRESARYRDQNVTQQKRGAERQKKRHKGIHTEAQRQDRARNSVGQRETDVGREKQGDTESYR